jgi:hypothetical protein
MTQRLAITTLLLGCVLFAAIIFLEFASGRAGEKTTIVAPRRLAAVLAAPPQQKGRFEKLVRVILARPLFSPTRHPATNRGKGAKADIALADTRLTGIITREGLRLAIFAIRGKKPLALTVGDKVSGWRIERIAPGAVALRGPEGLQNLAPRPDRTLPRPPLPAAFAAPAGRRRPGFAPVVRKPPPPRFGRATPLRRGPAPWR